MGLIHDLGESIIGDITPCDNVSKEDKHAMEEVLLFFDSNNQKAILQIVKDFPKPLSDEFISLWREYEEQETPASHYVFDFDKLDMLIQANQYEQDQGLDLQEFFTSTEPLFKTPYGLSVSLILRINNQQLKILSEKRNNRRNASNSYVYSNKQ